jgi:integrase
MAEDRLAHNEVINLAGVLWNILCREYSSDLIDFQKAQLLQVPQPLLANYEEDPSHKLKQVASQAIRSQTQQDPISQNSRMSIASFVENKFVPEHVALKRASGRAHYKAMLKHVLRPEEVDRMLSVRRKRSGQTLKTVPGWPYLSDVRLCDMQPSHVDRLTSAAAARGYSVYTVMHMRNVVSAIFSHARQEKYFVGDNPVSLVRAPEVPRRRTLVLTLSQAREALGVMKYPEREMTVLAVCSGMNLAEILGLQWKQVNLTQAEITNEGKRIPPRSIAVNNQLYRGRLEPVKKSHVRYFPIPSLLLQVLLKLKSRERFVGLDDFVFVSQVGTPVNQNNLLARRLRPIAKQLGVSSLSCQAFRGVRKILASESGIQFQNFAADLCLSSHSDVSEGSRISPTPRSSAASLTGR